MFLYLFI